jgi:hypothetical protein
MAQRSALDAIQALAPVTGMEKRFAARKPTHPRSSGRLGEEAGDARMAWLG